MAKNLSTRVFDTKAELKQNRGAALANAFVVENGGTYFWNNASTVTDDTDSVLQVTGVVTGRWVKSLEITITNNPASNATYNPVTRVMNIPPADATATETTKNFSTVASLRSSTFHTQAGTLVSKIIGLNGASFKWNPASTATDDAGVTAIQVTGVATGRWEKIFSGAVRLKEVGILTDGTNQATILNTLFSNTSVKEVHHDDSSVTINSGTIVNGQGKKLVLSNGAMVVGTGVISNVLVVAHDNDIVFGPTVTVQDICNTIISIAWLGAKADNSTDNRGFILKAIASTNASTGINPVIKIPANSNPSNRYYVSDEIDITRPVVFMGAGINETAIRFQDGKPGLKLSAPYIKLHDFTILGHSAFQSSGYNSDTAHGINITSGICSVKNVNSSFFDGDGIHLANTDAGLADNCFVEDCVFSFNGRFGIFARGGDSNANTFIHCNCSCNARWNIMEASFLGNLHLGHQSASGAQNAHSLQKTNIRHTLGGVTKNYACISRCTNIEPGVTTGWEGYWVEVGYGSQAGAFSFWDSSTTYYSGGGIFVGGYDPTAEEGVVNLNNDSTFIGIYSEPDQISLANASRAMILGGSLSTLSRGQNGVFTNVNGPISAGTIGSYGPTASYRFDTTNPNYHGLYMDAVGGSGKTVEVGVGWTRFRWANLYSGAYVIDPDFDPAQLGLTAARQGTDFAALSTGVYFRNNTTEEFRVVGTANAAPTTGIWGTGDLLINVGVTTPEAIFFKCTAGGSPGTWITISLPSTPSLAQFSAALPTNFTSTTDAWNDILSTSIAEGLWTISGAVTAKQLSSVGAFVAYRIIDTTNNVVVASGTNCFPTGNPYNTISLCYQHGVTGASTIKLQVRPIDNSNLEIRAFDYSGDINATVFSGIRIGDYTP